VRPESKTQLSEILAQRFGARLSNVVAGRPERIFAEFPPADVVELAQFMHQDLGARLSTITGVDDPDCFEIMYHFTFDYLGTMVSIRTKIANKAEPAINSIAPVIKGAEWIEREIWELLGVTFTNHPDMRHLLLMDDWPEGKYPLRRNYKGIDGKGGF
jgi:NADH-quinone oxidoreductase subunit C